MSLFSKQKTPPPPPNGTEEYHPIWSNFEFLFLTNFELIPFFLPSIVAMGLFLAFGGGLFLLAAMVLLLPVGPAVCAMYDVSYQLCREVPKHERRGFFASYRLNLKQGIATMAVQLPVIFLLLMLLLIQGEKPLWVTLCLILGSVILLAFSILAFSQTALVELPLLQIWNNALFLIPLTHWRSLVPAVVHLLYLAVLYQWLGWAFLLFLFLGPAMLIAWSANTLWPGLEPILIRGDDQ